MSAGSIGVATSVSIRFSPGVPAVGSAAMRHKNNAIWPRVTGSWGRYSVGVRPVVMPWPTSQITASR